jgi:hypothetical protein
MSTRKTNSRSRSGDRLSERAARGAMAHFRASSATGTLRAASDRASATVDDRRAARRSATDPQILRRWVVGDLIAAGSRRAFA